MLLCGIINELQRRPETNTSYFFCQATDDRINTATAALRGLMYLLVEKQPALISHIRDKYDRAGRSLFEDKNAWFALSEIFNDKILRDRGLRTTYLVVDALDEVNSSGLPKLLNLIIQTAETSTIKWIVSSRNELRIEDKLKHSTESFSLRLELNANSVSAAVQNYIRYKVNDLAQQKDYDANLKQYVDEYLTSHADGTFLWVAIVCQELALPEIRKRRTRAKLQTFPAGLVPLYRRMMQQIQSSPPEDVNLCTQILVIASLAFRPLTSSELQSLLEADDFDDSEALKEIIQLCGSFLTLRDGTVFFIHQSAKDFLTEHESTTIFPSGRTDTAHRSISRRSINAMSRILQRDIYKLRHPGFTIDISVEAEEVKRPSPDPLAPIGYACVYWIRHIYDEDIVHDDAAINVFALDIVAFLKVHLLHLFEALALLGRIEAGQFALDRLVDLLKVSNDFSGKEKLGSV